MRSPLRVILAALSAVGVAAASQARATLGEMVDSQTPVRGAISASQGQAAAGGQYSVRETVTDSTAVREFVSDSGVVFGIAWNGLTHPDLARLLGAYAAEYRDALERTPRTPGRRCHQVRTDRVVVEMWGHMRNLQGRAYLPLLVPPGMSADEIK